MSVKKYTLNISKYVLISFHYIFIFMQFWSSRLSHSEIKATKNILNITNLLKTPSKIDTNEWIYIVLDNSRAYMRWD